MFHSSEKKISKALGILYKAKTWVKHDTMLTLYNCFIYPYVMYCIDVWGGTSKKNLLSILKLQKRAIRLITSSPYRSESGNQHHCFYFIFSSFVSLTTPAAHTLFCPVTVIQCKYVYD